MRNGRLVLAVPGPPLVVTRISANTDSRKIVSISSTNASLTRQQPGAYAISYRASKAALKPGRPMADVFAAHVRVLDEAGMGAHRLNACGYSLGPRFSPSWMEDQMFYEGAPAVMEPGMVFFLHMILMDSETGTAMTLGRTSLVGATGAERLSRMPLEMVVR